MATDFELKGLLEGLADEDERQARIGLLEDLLAEDVTPEELGQAVRAGRLAILPVEQAMAGSGGPYTLSEVAQKSGIAEDTVRRLRASFGISVPEANEHVLSDDDVDLSRRFKEALDLGLSEQAMLKINRIVGSAMAQAAATIIDACFEAFLHPGDNEHELALRSAEAARLLRPMAAPVLDYALTAHLREQLSRAALTRAEVLSGRLQAARQINVCFADLTGFTRLGQTLPAEELGEVAGHLAELAAEAARPPVWLVKTIGDAAMLVAEQPTPLVEAALELVESVDRAAPGLPRLHAGIAAGRALSRGGDWYGHPVNLASRICSLAPRGSVLTTEEVKNAVGNQHHRWTWAGMQRLEGVSEPLQLWHVTRAGAPSG